MAWAHFKKSNRKVGRPKSTWKRELQNEKEINKTFSEALIVAAS